MEWMNYHHLLYFWTVVREGGVSKAARSCRSPLHRRSVRNCVAWKETGEKLLRRSGRNLVLTEMGRTVFSYAEDIFAWGANCWTRYAIALPAGRCESILAWSMSCPS